MEWIPVLLVLLVVVLYGLSQILDRGEVSRDPEAEALQKAADIKAAAHALLEKELLAVVADREELDRIMEIKDEEERLRALADYGNRRRR